MIVRGGRVAGKEVRADKEQDDRSAELFYP
jgi:hypothetical protein